MTVAGLIEQFNAERPNDIADEVKVGWLKECEHMIINEILISHEHDLEDEKRIVLGVSGSTLKITRAGSFKKHVDNFDMDTIPLVPEPYSVLYLRYLDQRIAWNNNDMKRYNVASASYNNAYLSYQQYCNRTYKTKRTPSVLLRHEVL